MKCVNCGADTDDKFRFCQYCGSQLPTEKTVMVINNYYKEPPKESSTAEVPIVAAAPAQALPIQEMPTVPQKKPNFFRRVANWFVSLSSWGAFAIAALWLIGVVVMQNEGKTNGAAFYLVLFLIFLILGI